MTYKKTIQTIFALSALCFAGQAQASEPLKTLAARKTQEKPPVIDGKLNDAVWAGQEASFSGYFTQSKPVNGSLGTEKTEVHLFYDDFAIYIGARLKDTEPTKILKEMGERDSRDKNTDVFGVGFDTYDNQQNAFFFLVSAAGVQTDILFTPNEDNASWNAVWRSAVNFDDEGWTVEIEIPYSALRFPKQDIQTWGVNFAREVRRKRELAFWSPIDVAKQGFVNQFGKLTGLENLKPPVRLSVTPYMSAGISSTSDGSGQKSVSKSYGGGMDLKYGINESFTLDMSLVPDFSQVQSDNLILNLSPFEVRFNEFRPFFTEGTEIFNKGNLFYSRRIGQARGASFDWGKIGDDDKITSSPSTSPLVNATKISGRTKKGLGLGFFNAVTNKSEITYDKATRVTDPVTGQSSLQYQSVTEEYDPLTNFNLLVFDQNLKNNSNISFTNANVMRKGNITDSNVSATEFSLFTKDNKFNVSGSGALSQHFNKDAESGKLKGAFGYRYALSAGKVSGRLQYRLSRNVESDTYNPNDFGYLQSPNKISHRWYMGYNWFQPFSVFQNMSIETWGNITHIYEPRKYSSAEAGSSFNATFKNFWQVGSEFGGNPGSVYDYFESRKPGQVFVRQGGSFYTTAWVSSDSRKKLSVSTYAGVWRRPNWNQTDNWMGISPNYRASNRLSFSLNTQFFKKREERGYVYNADHSDGLVFGKRNVQELTNTLSGSYAFTNTMTATLRVRHYRSRVVYDKFYSLDPKNGDTYESSHTGLDSEGKPMYNENFNTFNVDLVYRWVFAPGSEINVVYKNAILNSNQNVGYGMVENYRELFGAPMRNSFTMKILYYLDYFETKRRFKA